MSTTLYGFFAKTVEAFATLVVKLQKDADSAAAAHGAGTNMPDNDPLWNSVKTLLASDEFKAVTALAGQQGSQPFHQFLGDISRSIVDTQKILDIRSHDYLTQTPSHALPAIFRIPKISADIKFALDSKTSEGWNIAIYRHDGQSETRNEQSIQFDVVSVPPPPDTALKARPFELVLGSGERKAVLGNLAALAAAGTPLAAAVKDAPKTVVAIALPDLAGSPTYLIWLAEAGPGQVGLWLLLPAALQPFALNSVEMHGLIAGLADQQQRLLPDS